MMGILALRLTGSTLPFQLGVLRECLSPAALLPSSLLIALGPLGTPRPGKGHCRLSRGRSHLLSVLDSKRVSRPTSSPIRLCASSSEEPDSPPPAIFQTSWQLPSGREDRCFESNRGFLVLVQLDPRLVRSVCQSLI